MTKLDLNFFEKLSDIASKTSLSFFRKPIIIDNKSETLFDPVTQADKQTENALRSFILKNFADDGILGEECDNLRLDADNVWVIDPIDGTRSFIAGIPLWGTLIGRMHKGKAVAGMMAQPFIGELFCALDNKAYYKRNNEQEWQVLQVSATKKLEDAILFSTAPDLFLDGNKTAFEAVSQKARLTRWGTDCYAFAMLAAGYVDLVIETGLEPYDIMALIPIIENAGGVITQWNGGKAEGAGNIIAAATPELHAAACKLLNV